MKLYKKQLLEAYAPFGVVEVCHGEELAMYWEFNREKSLSSFIHRKEFSFYHPIRHAYLDKKEPYAKAWDYFSGHSNIFCEGERLICFIQFKEEYFGLKLRFANQVFQIICELNQSELLLINEELSKLLGLDRLEYVIEVVVFDEKNEKI
ncbi:hypothetical protein ACPDG9_09200 [Myroides sp. C6-3]